MEFLLALSALLSALTGAFGPRADARLDQAEAQLVAMAEAAVPTRAAALRPTQDLPPVGGLSAGMAEAEPAPPVPAPLAFVRLDE